MTLKASFLVVAFLMGVLAPAIAQTRQNKKPRKKLTELLLKADSLRLQLRQSADRGRMLQWGDSLLMAELGKSKMSEKKKQRFMKHYAKIQRRLSLYDRQLFRGDSLLAANYYKIKYDTAYISRPNARWTIKLRGNLSGADLETTAKTDGTETHTKVMAEAEEGSSDAEIPTIKNSMKYHFPSAIITGRGAAVYSWRNKFAGATAVYNFSVAGDEDHLQVKRNKWRVRMFFGFRF